MYISFGLICKLTDPFLYSHTHSRRIAENIWKIRHLLTTIKTIEALMTMNLTESPATKHGLRSFVSCGLEAILTAMRMFILIKAMMGESAIGSV